MSEHMLVPTACKEEYGVLCVSGARRKVFYW